MTCLPIITQYHTEHAWLCHTHHPDLLIIKIITAWQKNCCNYHASDNYVPLYCCFTFKIIHKFYKTSTHLNMYEKM